MIKLNQPPTSVRISIRFVICRTSLTINMIHNIWSDGYIMTKRYRRLNQVFPYLYALTYGFPEQYDIVYLEDGIKKQTYLDPVSRTLVDVYIDSLFAAGGARYSGLK